MYSAVDVAKYFVSLDRELSEIQVQKLVYYSYSWYIVKFNNDANNISQKLFEERPEAWIYGPVFRSLYNIMRRNNNLLAISDKYMSPIDLDTKNFLLIVYEVYGKYSGNELKDMTRSEKPWKIARCGVSEHQVKSRKKLNDKEIYEFYSMPTTYKYKLL